MTMQGRDIVCFANDWRTDPTSKHQLMKRIASANRILWVEASGMRRPNLGSRDDLGRIARKVRSFFAHSRPEIPGLHSFSPPTLPLPGSDLADKLNAWLYRITLRRELRRLGMSQEPLLWVYGPHVAPWIRGLPRSGLVYHCVDKWSAFQDYDAARMTACEAEICREADLVLASAEDLAERCRQYRADVNYVPHGVEHDHFAQALQPGPLPPDIATLPEPRVGFFGLIHEWVDTDLIGALADQLPYQFVLIGASNQDLTALLARPNVHYLGRKPYGTLPDYCRGFAAAIVPFRISELTLSVNPIKLREYAAAGLPVVASDLPEIRRCGEIASCVSGVDAWEAALRRAIREGQDPAARQRQSDRVRSEDWGAVADRVGEMVNATVPVVD
jgi:glycosyltransferase involved in cell wall biosynthesis